MRKGFRHDNRGLTLVELLVSVMILGIIAAPLLHAFVSSAGTAAKSRALGDATLAARNVAETIDATHMDTLVSSLNDGSADSLFLAELAAAELPEGAAELEKGASSYGFKLYGLPSGGRDFDARVTMDASRFPDANNVLVTKYMPMDVVFSQPSSAGQNPDFQAAMDFSAVAVGDSGDSSFDTDYFLRHMTRTITVTVAREETGGKITARAYYDYSCEVSYTHTATAEDGTQIEEIRSLSLLDFADYEFFRGTELTSIYFFFFPSYTVEDDLIWIENLDDLEFSFFLIKQKALVLGGDGVTVSAMPDDEIRENEGYYNPIVKLWEPVKRPMPHASLYSNINADVSGLVPGDYTPSAFSYDVYYGEGRVWYSSKTLSGTLVATEPQNRFFRVAVDIYPAGADMDTEDPLFTLDASKLD